MLAVYVGGVRPCCAWSVLLSACCHYRTSVLYLRAGARSAEEELVGIFLCGCHASHRIYLLLRNCADHTHGKSTKISPLGVSWGVSLDLFQDVRRKVAKIVASKLTLAARVDSSHRNPDGDFGESEWFLFAWTWN